jgi:hypothetical protein
MAFAFEILNLTRNPFGEPTRPERAELALMDTRAWVDLLKKPGQAIQFMGEGGRGKSTHLHAIRLSFPDLPFTYLGEGERFVRIPRAPVVFLDEVQRLHPLWRFFLFRRRASFALATHQDLRRELEGAGLQVQNVEVGVLDAQRLGAIFEKRIEWARRGPGPVPTLPPPTLAALQAHFGTDLRAMESHLYDVFQSLRQTGPVLLSF